MIKSLEDFKVYCLAMELGQDIWRVVAGWSYFEKDTLGKQFIRAADSVAEGLGRFHYKEAKQFGYYSRGSLFETKTWATKAFERQLIDKPTFTLMQEKIETIGKMLNGYIGSIGSVNEPGVIYGSPKINS